jgi:hypothetical protein
VYAYETGEAKTFAHRAVSASVRFVCVTALALGVSVLGAEAKKKPNPVEEPILDPGNGAPLTLVISLKDRVHAEINNEAAQAFKQALKIRGHREAQLADDKHCRGVGLCEVCDEYERLVAIVNTAFDVRTWKLSPVDVIDGPPPPMWKDREKADWDRARDQHVALAKAAGMKPRQRGLLTDGCRGQRNVRWIERHGKIPDGPTVRKPFRLLEFQRDIIRSIYGDPAYWQAVDAVLKKGREAGGICYGRFSDGR